MSSSISRIAAAGCASQTAQAEDIKQFLAAEGCRAAPVMTPQERKELPLSPLLRLTMQPRRITGVGHVHAGAVLCHFVFSSSTDDFARVQQLTFQQRLADPSPQPKCSSLQISAGVGTRLLVAGTHRSCA